MVELRPYPFAALLRRLLHDCAQGGDILDVPRHRIFGGLEGKDLSVQLAGERASSSLGPAAGPHTQMAQNILMAYLAGCRIFELKTVQVQDQLEIPRPCIDMQTIGFNVEWSQELRLQQSLEEYVKARMLIEILRSQELLPAAAGFDEVVFDMSVGYDLAGIRSAGVQAFLDGMRDCSAVLERLRRQIPDDLAHLRALDYPTCISKTLTLSTFHGCPPGEIEDIASFLLQKRGLNTVVKFNPTLLGAERLGHILHEELGYEELLVPDRAFEADTKWEEAVDICERLAALAEGLDLGFGIKLTNTLIVENHRDFFPAQAREMYLSGQPLHVLAIQLAQDFRATFGHRFPLSFSAGIDARNFPEALALDLLPVTVCTDLLRQGGYGRAAGYYKALERRMEAVGARDLGEWVIRALGQGAEALELAAEQEPRERLAACRAALEKGGELAPAAGEQLLARWRSQASLLNTKLYAEQVLEDPRYASSKNRRAPKKLGVALELLDCTNCDLCIPVCPNGANFRFQLEPGELERIEVRPKDGGFVFQSLGTLEIKERQQIASFADFCNECGNCDVFCPEDGGPYLIKARFFGSLADWQTFEDFDGFACTSDGTGRCLHARVEGVAYRLHSLPGELLFEGPDFELRYDPADLEGSLEGRVGSSADLGLGQLLHRILEAVYPPEAGSYAALLAASPQEGGAGDE